MADILESRPATDFDHREQFGKGFSRHPVTPKLWVVLPAYNEQDAIEKLILKIANVDVKNDIRIVVVDDASTDDTLKILRRIQDSYPLSIVQHRQNQGLAGAIRTGFSYFLKHGSPNDVMVTMDADDTHSPATIPQMLVKIDEGYDVVIASRYQAGSRTIGVPFNRQVLTWLARWMFKIVTPISGVRDYTCGFRAYRFSAMDKASKYYGDKFVSEKGFSCMVDVLLKMRRFDFVMGEVAMLLRYDQKAGPSKMKVAKTSLQTLKLLFRRRFVG